MDMNNITWHQMNKLDTLTYEMKALLEVVTDGLNNDVCPSNTEDSSAVIRQAIEKLVTVREIHECMWKQQREARADDGRTDEDADEGEDFDTKDLFHGELWKDEEDNAEPTPCFTVEELAKNEDGSATYTVDASDEDMKKLFEVFFTQAVINGIKYTAADNNKEVAKTKALEVARDFEFMVRMWETSDSFEYEPDVRRKREELSQALKEAGV
jgi:hypothetical protein